jgi:hypothetical protein
MSLKCQAFLKHLNRTCNINARKNELFCGKHLSEKISTNVEKQKIGKQLLESKNDEIKDVTTIDKKTGIPISVKNEIKNKTKDDAKVDLKDKIIGIPISIKDGIKHEIKDKTKDSVKNDVKGKIKDEINELKDEIKHDDKQEIKNEIENKSEDDENDKKDEIKNNVDQLEKNRIALENYKKFVDTKTYIFIEKALAVHGTLYDYSESKYTNNHTKIIIKCLIHNLFSQRPAGHLSGSGCEQCGRKTAGKNNKARLTTEQYIQRCQEIHGRERYDYSETVYTNNRGKVKIICRRHSQFIQQANVHYRSECPKCSLEDAEHPGILYTKEEFIKKAKEVHGDQYGYDRVIYVNSGTYVEIICYLHGEYNQAPKYHLSGSGCPKCGIVSTNLEDFIKKAKEVHGDIYQYHKSEYVNVTTPVEVICKFHNESFFVMKFADHVRKAGCPLCMLCPSCFTTKSYGVICTDCITVNIEKRHYKKTKEEQVVCFLENQLLEEKLIVNRSVGDEYTGQHLFPDIRIERKNFQLIIEIDEFEHKGNGYHCENKRMYDIIAKLKSPCIFIRYNPDLNISDKNILLQTIQYYLNLDNDPNLKQLFDDFGLKVEYLFYTITEKTN